MFKNNPEAVLKKFLKCWQNQNWIEMLKYVQITWKRENETPISKLMDYFGHIEIIKIDILITKKLNDVITDIIFCIKYKFGKNLLNGKYKARLICEKAPYKPEPDGKWGVNPVSVLKDV